MTNTYEFAKTVANELIGSPNPRLARSLMSNLESFEACSSKYMNFQSREEYLECVKQWRLRHKEIEKTIRAHKAARSSEGYDARATAQSYAMLWKDVAHAALIERAMMKKKAAHCRDLALQENLVLV